MLMSLAKKIDLFSIFITKVLEQFMSILPIPNRVCFLCYGQQLVCLKITKF